jgi:uncharacterized lipoprotein YddW (UPF0748 family)
MKYFFIIVIMLIITTNLFAQNNDEFRGVWVITWEHISSSRTAEENKAQVRKILDDVKKANMNAVLWQARQGGTAYYNSSYEPWGSYAGSSYPGYDPLAYAIEEGHKRGIEVHAWFNVFAASSTAPGTPASNNPHWICRDQAGIPMVSSRALSPGLDTVRAYAINVAMEIVRNYDIDGLHLDYVRWNEYSNSEKSKIYADFAEKNNLLDGMINDEQILDLETNKAGRYLYDVDHPYSGGVPSGFGTWEEWWRNGVTEFVRVLHDSVQSIKPWVRLSPAALGKYNWSGWQGYGSVFQDAALWFNQGYIEQLTPMNYHWTTAAGFYDMLVGGCPQCWGQWIQQGTNAGRIFSVGPGSYNFGNNWKNHPSVVDRCRDVSWVDGFQFFSYGSWEDRKYWTEAGETFFEYNTKIRDTGLISTAVPDEPSISIIKLDSLNYEITITPNASLSEDNWFALYRSEVGGVSTDTTNVASIRFGDSIHTVVESFDGLQNYNGIYTYGATTLNRYWNESIVSNTVTTDAIPSLAPIVTETEPIENDTIAVNKNIDILFSKEMDINSLDSAITFTPVIGIDQITWSTKWPDKNKRMTIYPAGNLQFATGYTLEIDANATDMNGVSIDGNGDGIPGDSFVLDFHTKAVDDEGPVVTFTYPSFNTWVDTFDVRDVITVVFNELIDHNSIDDTIMAWKKGGTTLNTHYLITDMHEKSILSIGSFDTLISNTNHTFELRNDVLDTIGNPMLSDLQFSFKTADEHYIEDIMIANFSSSIGTWEDPDYSGSTVGTLPPQTTWGISNSVYLPASATAPIQRKAGFINYRWDTSASNFLLREYLSGGAPRDIHFDTTYVLQVYVFGDGSNNKFRFAMDEGDGSSWPNHEVSKWVTIDWYGWKLVEWDLSDPNSLGTWIGNGILDFPLYRIDSFQMTYDPINGAESGRIYLDNFRLVKKDIDYTRIEIQDNKLPKSFSLEQNYPNPFNPTTKIDFALPKAAQTSLIVYDMLGRKVGEIVNDYLKPGRYSVSFNGENISSGLYVYVLRSGKEQSIKKMMLVK